jgi:uncharacterized membrane protein YphA (DoxX/SURF4 family)
MADPWNDSNAGRWVGNDPGQYLRCWVAGFLRVGIGVRLLSAGLIEYFGQRNPMRGGNAWGQGIVSGGLDPLVSALPYFAIGLGLALILGFMTTVAAIGSAFFSLLTPLLTTIAVILSMGTSMPNQGLGPFLDMFRSAGISNLLPYAALIWLSPLENHPISIDALIFGRNEFAPTIAPPSRPEVEVRQEASPRSEGTEAHSSG